MTAQAGDLVLIRAGTYAEQLAPVNNCSPDVKDQILPTNIPAETLPIIFAAYPNEKPILNGSGVSLTKVLQNARFNGLVHTMEFLWRQSKVEQLKILEFTIILFIM